MAYTDDRELDEIRAVQKAKFGGLMLEQPVARLSTLRLILLTIGFAGLQIVFSLIFSNGSAFLRTLGLHDSIIALVWLGGPICGAVLQPYFGLRSEHCHSRWGRRRPYIAGGAVAVILSLLGLASVDAYATAAASTTTSTLCQAAAILGMTALNASIQPLQGGLRALLVDASPPHQLAAANAWASRLTCVANVLGYLAGFLDLSGPSSSSSSSVLGGSQFRVLCVLCAAAIVATASLTCATVSETPSAEPAAAPAGGEATMRRVLSQLGYIYSRFRRLPSMARRVCYVQFCAWLAWAPYLFYIALYIGDIYQRQTLERNPQTESTRKLTQDATRMGSLGLLLFATTALLTGFALPMMLLRRQEEDAYRMVEKDQGAEPEPTRAAARGPGARIQRVWMWSHVLYAACIMATFFVKSLGGTYVLVSLCGVSWGVTIWAPFSLISMAIRDEEDEEEEEETDRDGREEDASEAAASDADHEQVERRPGIVMALHNAAISAPQIVAVAVSSIVFRAFNSSVASGSDAGIVWTLRLTALSAVAAAVMARKGFQ